MMTEKLSQFNWIAEMTDLVSREQHIPLEVGPGDLDGDLLVTCVLER